MHTNARNPSSMDRSRLNKQREVARRRPAHPVLVWPGARLSVIPPLLGARAERSPEGTRRQEDGPEMGRGHIGGGEQSR